MKRKKVNYGINILVILEKKRLDLLDSNLREINLNEVGFIGEDRIFLFDNIDGKFGKIWFVFYYNVVKIEF